MKLAPLIATSVAALIVTAAIAQPAAACGWKRYGYGAAAADEAPVRGYRSTRYYRPYRAYRSYGLYQPRLYRPYRGYRSIGVGRVGRRW